VKLTQEQARAIWASMKKHLPHIAKKVEREALEKQLFEGTDIDRERFEALEQCLFRAHWLAKNGGGTLGQCVAQAAWDCNIVLDKREERAVLLTVAKAAAQGI
jgi:hypothetical protein